MVVDGRSGPNKLRVFQTEGVGIVQYVCRALSGAHSKEDGVHNTCQLSFNALMCSKYLYRILNRMHVTAPRSWLPNSLETCLMLLFFSPLIVIQTYAPLKNECLRLSSHKERFLTVTDELSQHQPNLPKSRGVERQKCCLHGYILRNPGAP